MQLAYNVLPPQETADFYNQTTLSIAMVETREAIEAVDEIAAVEGLDVVMIGGNDLTTSMEIPGQTDNPRVIEAFEALTAACKKHDKFAGMGGVNNDEHAKRYVDMGVRFILGGADTGFLASGAATRTAALRRLSNSRRYARSELRDIPRQPKCQVRNEHHQHQTDDVGGENGAIPLNMLESGTSGIIVLMTKTLRPMGGVIRLISTTMTMTIPNQIKSKPRASTSGTNMGTVRKSSPAPR